MANFRPCWKTKKLEDEKTKELAQKLKI